MPFISLTRLRLRQLTTLPAFIREVNAINAQLRASEGFLGGALLVEGRMVAWTRSAWESEEAMKAFRDTGAHRASMPKLMEWCDEAAVAHWQGEMVPDWNAIHARMASDLRLSRVKHPTLAHQEKRIAPLRRWLPEQNIAPERKS